MHTVSSIPGIKLEVYKESRLLNPESDGFVGELYSGSATILAVVSPDADKTIGIFRDGQDHYILQRNWLDSLDLFPGPTKEERLTDWKNPRRPSPREKQQRRQEFLGGRSFDQDSKVFGVKIPLKTGDRDRSINTVHYPENMLMLAQYVRENGVLTGEAHIWEVALVSQEGKFFLTVHWHCSTPAFKSLKNTVCFPGSTRHRLLEKVLVENVPDDLPLLPISFMEPMEKMRPKGLRKNEGIVESWYAPRNMGCILTSQGPVRVHWTDVPPRPRLRFLKDGEKVRFLELRVPPENPKTEFRAVRKAQFELQAYGIEVNS